MWIYKSTQRETRLINANHIEYFSLNGAAIYMTMKDGAIEKFIDAYSQESAEACLKWIAEKMSMNMQHGSVWFANTDIELLIKVWPYAREVH